MLQQLEAVNASLPQWQDHSPKTPFPGAGRHQNAQTGCQPKPLPPLGYRFFDPETNNTTGHRDNQSAGMPVGGMSQMAKVWLRAIQSAENRRAD